MVASTQTKSTSSPQITTNQPLESTRSTAPLPTETSLCIRPPVSCTNKRQATSPMDVDKEIKGHLSKLLGKYEGGNDAKRQKLTRVTWAQTPSIHPFDPKSIPSKRGEIKSIIDATTSSSPHDVNDQLELRNTTESSVDDQPSCPDTICVNNIKANADQFIGLSPLVSSRTINQLNTPLSTADSKSKQISADHPISTINNFTTSTGATIADYTSVVDIDDATIQTPSAVTTVSNTQILSQQLKRNQHRPWWPPNITKEIIRTILNEPCPKPSSPLFSFKLTEEAANKNFCIMRKFNWCLKSAIEAQQDSPVGYGSEFRSVTVLERLLYLHPNWTHFKRLLTHGSNWPLSPIDDKERHIDVEEALAFGNHKGARDDTPLLHSLIMDDVTQGFVLPLPLDKITRIPGIILSPMNIVRQNTIDETGKIVPKDRLTHDQSFLFSGSNTSVNSRLDKSLLLPCQFGWVIRRMINWVVAARRKYPNRRIYATKSDFKSAYRRCHLYFLTALQSCTQLPELNIALMALRLTFGGAACPYEWSVISETICDLATAIAHDDDWDPDELQSPLQHLIPPPEFLPDDIPFEEGKELAVHIEVSDRGTHEMYLDDLIGLGIDLPGTSNIKRSEAAPLLAIHSCARPIHEHEPIPRTHMISKTKLDAEANLSEIKIILGWRWDFRRLIISLPDNKFTAWTDGISVILNTRRVTTKELESTIGRLGHLSLVLPFVHHFLSRLRELLTRSKRQNRHTTAVPQLCLDDLELMLFFLQKANSGINMNHIAYRKPTHVYRSDSCPAGIGGYSNEGFAWRYYIPNHLLFRASNNLLEHLASVISPWVDIIAGRLREGDCALSMTDSTTSEGWLRKTNFKEDMDVVQASTRILVAREHARRYMNLGLRDFSQWFPGTENNVADSLSRDMHLSDETLISLLHNTHPSQVPPKFRIVPLPNEIVLWLTSLLQRLPVKEQYKEEHTPATPAHGGDGQTTFNPLDLNLISSSNLSPASNKPSSSAPSVPQSEKEDFLEHLQLPWLLRQSEAPSITWSRPSGATAIQTQPETTMENSPGF